VSNRRRNRGSLSPRAGYRRAGYQGAGYLSGLGQVLAALALLLQIAIPGLHRPTLAISISSTGDSYGAYDEHALCVAWTSSDPGPAAPADQVPKPTRPDLAACCFWHGGTGFALAPTAIIEPVTFAGSAVDFHPLPVDVRTLFPVTIRARAPPVRV
jgi:hypothetical protein